MPVDTVVTYLIRDQLVIKLHNGEPGSDHLLRAIELQTTGSKQTLKV